MIEIERKFLVKSEALNGRCSKGKNCTRFLNTDPLRTVRVRIKGDKGYMTVKGKGNHNGTTRFEWEKEISVKEADALIKLSEPGVIDKLRYYIEVGKHIFEVDEFFGDNSGLIIAEIELEHEDDDFLKPQWLGDEVTADVRYYNSQLSKNPFKTWKK